MFGCLRFSDSMKKIFTFFLLFLFIIVFSQKQLTEKQIDSVQNTIITTNAENANRIVHVIHSATPDQYETLLELSKKRNAGFLMITTDMPNIPYENLPQNFKNLILSINNSTPNVISAINSNLEKELKIDTEILEQQPEPSNTKISALFQNSETTPNQFNSSGKYNISGNLYISSIDLWNLLNNHYKNNSENRFDNNFDFGFEILNDFVADTSYKIRDKFGNFKIELRKKWNV